MGAGPQGVSTIFVSSELEELLETCHRILVMRQGRITQEVDPETTDVKHCMPCAWEGKHEQSQGA